ncbi:MFS transporter [Pseudonocardia sp. GCM10023141]|uniref:MFS transporter n=1 Tax=Pseudonocardia sp. GCM10023141 TaxID=3252653 RepID=UPI00361A2C49
MTNPTASRAAVPPIAGRRQWWGLAVLALPTLLSAVDMNVLFLALSHLAHDLDPTAAEQLWITDVYGFVLAGFLITMGTFGDRVGRRKLLFLGGSVFACVSVVAAYSVSPLMLIVCRALLGIAGATLMPSTMALITTMFRDGRQRGVAIAIWATCLFGGAALGPVVGGVLLERFWWGSVFLLAVPVVVATLLVGPFVLPESRGADAGRLDLASVGLSLGAVLPIVYGIKALATGSSSPMVGVASLLGGVLLAVVFVRRQLTLETPLLDLGLFRLSRVSIVLVTLVGAGVVMAGAGLLITQYLQSVLGYSPLESAVLFAPMGLAVAAGTMLTPAITRHVTEKGAICGGLVLAAIGAAVLLLVPADGGAATAIVAVAVLALGTGPLFALGVGYIVGAVPTGRAGAAASLSETGNYVGGALGMALMGTLGAVVYRARMAELVPDGASGALARARETIAGAVDAAAGMAPVDAARLLDTAHAAFTGSVHTIGAIGAVVFLVLAAAITRISLATAGSPR